MCVYIMPLAAMLLGVYILFSKVCVIPGVCVFLVCVPDVRYSWCMYDLFLVCYL